MWMLYKQMMTDRVDLDRVSYTALIMFFAKSTKRDDVKKADMILQVMEESVNKDIQPNSKHVIAILHGFVKTGDAENATRMLIRNAEAYTSR